MLLQRTATSEAPYPTKQPLTTSPIMPWGVDNTRLADLFNAALTANTMLAMTKNSLSLYFSVRGCFGVFFLVYNKAATTHSPESALKSVYNATGEICGVWMGGTRTQLSVHSVTPMHFSWNNTLDKYFTWMHARRCRDKHAGDQKHNQRKST